MSLRWRLALLFALLAAAAATAAAGVAYVAVDNRLTFEVNDSLQQAAGQLRNANGAANPAPGATPALQDAGGRPASPGFGLGTPPERVPEPDVSSTPATPAPTAPTQSSPSPTPRPPVGLLDLVVVERINASGAVISQGSQDGSVTLPVTTEDRLIAADSGAPWLRTEDVDGVPFRIITVPSPGGGAVLLARDLDETNQVLASLRVWFGLLDLSVIVLAAAAGWLIARRIAAPLLHLTATAEDVATKGVFQGSVESSRRDEVGRLARAFAAMLTVLDRSRQQQHQLVRDAGHELRTPLTSIRSNVDLLHRYPDLPAATRENLLGDLESELRELTTLVDEIVELATDSHGAEADTAVHIEELTARAAHRVEKRSGRHITLAGAPWVVVGREKALERAVSNLLDNAVKFSPDGSPIEVTLRPGHLEVRDYGPGIPDADLPAVFQRFYRANSARSKPGSGLGLSIVRQVVEDHGGTVFAQNAPGGGAVIGFDLPLLHP